MTPLLLHPYLIVHCKTRNVQEQIIENRTLYRKCGAPKNRSLPTAFRGPWHHEKGGFRCPNATTVGGVIWKARFFLI
jgi:hypothetical protein